MKKLLMAAPVALAMAMTAGTAAAAESGSGTIYFTGEIKAGTCAIDVTTPGSPAGNRIFLGQATPADFGAAGTEVNNTKFALVVDPANGCSVNDGVAKVNFASNDGAHPGNPQLHALRAGTAQGVGIAIRDASTKLIIAHGADSKDFTTVKDQPLVMDFTAGYMSTVASANIVAGDAYADVNFTVTLP
ncbi:fimbrial protein [Pseudomonas sp. MWU16-30317]|uniref:fimbrial protein n=1 Tax=Pseudomonas sp. MWU16-30317 TaxID=2878095 RepID=UPI001CFC266C|nr:fimbrial protein [Pseudomonas sp. MWU16-30317]